MYIFINTFKLYNYNVKAYLDILGEKKHLKNPQN